MPSLFYTHLCDACGWYGLCANKDAVVSLGAAKQCYQECNECKGPVRRVRWHPPNKPDAAPRALQAAG